MLPHALMVVATLGAAPWAGSVSVGTQRAQGVWHQQAILRARSANADSIQWQGHLMGHVGPQGRLIWLPAQGQGAITHPWHAVWAAGMQVSGPWGHVAWGDVPEALAQARPGSQSLGVRGARLHLSVPQSPRSAWLTVLVGHKPVPVAASGIRFLGDAWTPQTRLQKSALLRHAAGIRLPYATRATVARVAVGGEKLLGKNRLQVRGTGALRHVQVVQATQGRPVLAPGALPGATHRFTLGATWQPLFGPYSVRLIARWAQGARLGVVWGHVRQRTVVQGRLGAGGRGLRGATQWHQGHLAGLELGGAWRRRGHAASWDLHASHAQIASYRAWRAGLGVQVHQRAGQPPSIRSRWVVASPSKQLHMLLPLRPTLGQSAQSAQIALVWSTRLGRLRAQGHFSSGSPRPAGPTVMLDVTAAF